MTLSKQKGPRKNGPFCFCFLCRAEFPDFKTAFGKDPFYFRNAANGKFYGVFSLFNVQSAKRRERNRQSENVNPAKSEGMNCQTVVQSVKVSKRQKKTRRSASGNFYVMGFSIYDLHEFVKHPPQCSSLVWYGLIITRDYCKPHTKM